VCDIWQFETFLFGAIVEFMKKLFMLLLLSISPATAIMAQKTITSPEAAFGFKPGTDRKLADWSELTAYFKKLAAESDRIRYEEVGKTTEGASLHYGNDLCS
jgi:hypothetical protein